MSHHSVQSDLYAMFQERQALEFMEWVNRVEEHVSTLKSKLCKSCKSNKLEVVNMHKAECQDCLTLNDF